jgi:energy-coupling factor transporter transmembrane protein EcfT
MSRAQRPGRRRPAATVTEVNLFRHVPGNSPIHRLWPGTKVAALVAVGITLSFRPTWVGEGLVFALLGLAMILSRVPLGALPRFPRWFWYGVAFTAVSSALAGGKPYLGLGQTRLGLGGIDEWTRFTVFVLLLIGATALVGWTTKAAELTPALATLVRPARLLRIPVDEMAVVVSLSVRCMPLLVDELRTLWAARRVRNPPQPDSLRDVFRELHDILVTALVSATRRAQEMADAIVARGGVGSTQHSAPRWTSGEILAWVLTGGVVVGVALL